MTARGNIATIARFKENTWQIQAYCEGKDTSKALCIKTLAGKWLAISTLRKVLNFVVADLLHCVQKILFFLVINIGQ